MQSPWKMLALAVFSLSGCMCAWGQGAGSPPPPTSGQSAAPMGMRRSIEGGAELRYLTQQLSLTPDQREKLRPILTDQGDQLSVVRLDEHLPPDQKRAKTLEIREAFRPKIAAVLTPEQLEKWKKMQAPPRAQPPAAGQSAPAKPQ
jgi:Spy/CpxP family protein refolding chaperone